MALLPPPPSPQRILDIAPFNMISLNCSVNVTVRAELVPLDLVFQWQGSVGPSAPLQDLANDSFTVSNLEASSVLSVSADESGSHHYLCRVTLNVSPAPDNLTESIMQSIMVYGESDVGVADGCGLCLCSNFYPHFPVSTIRPSPIPKDGVCQHLQEQEVQISK